MEGFQLLKMMGFWVKLFVIAWWSAVIGTYVWFMGLVPKCPVAMHWLSVVSATLIGGAGLNHLSNLYRIKVEDFSLRFTLPAIYVSIGAVVLIGGAFFFEWHREVWARAISIGYILIGIVLIVLGSDEAPKNESA